MAEDCFIRVLFSLPGREFKMARIFPIGSLRLISSSYCYCYCYHGDQSIIVKSAIFCVILVIINIIIHTTFIIDDYIVIIMFIILL